MHASAPNNAPAKLVATQPYPANSYLVVFCLNHLHYWIFDCSLNPFILDHRAIGSRPHGQEIRGEFHLGNFVSGHR